MKYWKLKLLHSSELGLGVLRRKMKKGEEGRQMRKTGGASAGPSGAKPMSLIHTAR